MLHLLERFLLGSVSLGVAALKRVKTKAPNGFQHCGEEQLVQAVCGGLRGHCGHGHLPHGGAFPGDHEAAEAHRGTAFLPRPGEADSAALSPGTGK